MVTAMSVNASQGELGTQSTRQSRLNIGMYSAHGTARGANLFN